MFIAYLPLLENGNKKTVIQGPRIQNGKPQICAIPFWYSMIVMSFGYLINRISPKEREKGCYRHCEVSFIS